MIRHNLGNLRYPANPYLVLADMLLATLFAFILYALVLTFQANEKEVIIRQQQDSVEQVARQVFGPQAVRLDKSGPGRESRQVYQNLDNVSFILKRDAASEKFIFVNDTLFTARSARLTAGGREALGKMVRILDALGAGQYVKLVIEGYSVRSESSQPLQKNRDRELQTLSTERANAVLNQLVFAHNIPAERVLAAGSGWHNALPYHDALDRHNDRVNRRVQIEVRFSSRDLDRQRATLEP